MKIQIIESEKRTTLKDINVGDVFVVYGDDVCMKVEEVETADGRCLNVVNLESGKMDLVDINYPIQPVSIECKIIQ